MSHHPAEVDVAVIAAAAAGDRAALEEIFRVYQAPLVRFLRTLAPDLADDVASATWMSVTTSLPRFEGDGRTLRSWILTIGRRRMVDELRRRGRDRSTPTEPPERPDPLTTEDVARTGPGRAEQLLARLPPRQAEVISLRVLAGMSTEEVAEELGLTPGNVRVLAHRGLTRLREELAVATPGDAARAAGRADGEDAPVGADR